MTRDELHAAFARAAEEYNRLSRRPPSATVRARLAQLDRERHRLARLIREADERERP